MFDNELLRAFIAVAEGPGFTRGGATASHGSAVSGQIKRLELQAGCELLTRSTRSVALTPRGEILLEYARRILSLHDDPETRLGTARLAVWTSREGNLPSQRAMLDAARALTAPAGTMQ
jgi:DNA-binding transcriptional LysR family regulator